MQMTPRIVPVLVGMATSVWQEFLKSSLGELAYLAAQVSVANYSEFPAQLQSLRDQFGSQSVLLLLVDLDAKELQGTFRSSFLSMVKGDGPFGESVMVVVQSTPQVSRFRKEFSTDTAVVSSRDPNAPRLQLESMLSTDADTANVKSSSVASDPASNIAAKSEGSSSSSAQISKNAAPESQQTDDVDAADNDEAGGFDDFSEDEFTGLAWSILAVARRLGEGRPRPRVTSVRRLLASLLLSADEDPYTGKWLVSLIDRDSQAIRKRLEEQYPVVLQHEGSFASIRSHDSGVALLMTAKLREVLDLAVRLAKESQPGDPKARVGARHLLGAAVRRTESNTNVGRFLRDFGLNVDVVRNRMIETLPSWDVPDDPEVWLRLLDPVPDVVSERTVPTYASDAAVGPDWIGITREVEAMASLASAWSVEPPLSIGLFGEWGSGKSFFMQKMKERVHQISREARKSGAGQKEFGYYKNIVQVEFNAWHYVEGNLWASLVEHIFANLKLEAADGEDIDSEENIAKRLQRLLNEVREKTADAEKLDEQAQALTDAATREKEEAEERARRLENEADASRKQAEDADRERANFHRLADEAQRESQDKAEERRQIELKDLIDEVVGSKKLKEEVETGLAELGITRERLDTVEDMRGALREATDAGTLISQGINILRNDKQRWRLLIWVLIVPTLIAGVAFGVQWLTGQQHSQWLQSIIGVVSAVSAVPAFLVGAWKKYEPKLKPVLDTIERLKQKRALLESRVEEARKIRSERSLALEKESEGKKAEADLLRQQANEKLIQADAERRAAAAKHLEAAAMGSKADQARRDAAKLAQDADLLRPERRIATFIQDRAAAKDYRRYLGVPATIRRDFEKLAAMFRTQRQKEDQDKDGLDDDTGLPVNGRNNPAVVNRIILYIDDLDRCPPKKVVEVLQAIHLLLAFPLFVVIVAVDARWMKRSLRNQFALMLSGASGPVDAAPANLPEADSRDGNTATPDDYLEKIFQVPFWIRPLGPTASKNLVRELTRNDLRAPDDDTSSRDKTNAQIANRANAPANPVAASAMIQAPAPQAAIVAKNVASIGEDPELPTRFDWSPVEPKPRTLNLSADERNYMISLASVIGRSPRAVKRFVNCYRLAKMTLDPARISRYERDGTFKTTMLLLGVVSGMTEIAPELLSNLRKADKKKSPTVWAQDVAKLLDLADRARWKELLPIIALLENSGVRSIAPLVTAADHVDRFSFNPVRSAPKE